jgi:hypothetical protein
MTCRKLLIAVAVLLCELPAAQAQYPYYYKNKWYAASGPRGRYYYTHYYYAPRVYHHAYYYPYMSRRYVYYYNWKTRRYWGRFDLSTGKYSLLPEKKRKENLNDIQEKDFPEPQPVDSVVIPGSTDTMTAPPVLPREG